MSQTTTESDSEAQTRGARDEFSAAMAEDLAEWMSRLFPELVGDLQGDNFFDKISDGTLLCHYASELHRRMIESDSDSKKDSRRRLQGVRVGGVNAFLPAEPPKYNTRGLKSQNLAGGSFWARDNIANFLKWCRSVGFPDSILFETEDLVSRKHLRSVIVCLMEVARLGGKFGMEVPEIVHLEKQIDAELAAEPGSVPKGESEDKPSTPKGNSPASEMASLDEVVNEILAECTCNPTFRMVRLSEGRYIYGDKNTPIFVRLLRGHVMVRTDGDWDTLNHFLEEHDACRKITPLVDLTCQSTANLTAGPLQLKPPKEFRLQVLDLEPADLKPTPTAYLAELGKKRAIHQEEDLLKQVDEHALLVAQQKQKNFKQLIWQLIYARNIISELERVRAIFLWLCTKDLNKMNFENVKPGSPEETLMDIRANNTSYAQAFLTLCRYADLHCKLISGYAKGVYYSPGMQFTGSDHKHCWNAVLIDGTWCLVDCEWGARSKAKKGTNRGKLSYGLETYYFLTDPGQLIYTHFPHDKDWQLLHQPITMKEFECFAYVRPAFFKYNLTVPSQRNAVITSKDSEVRIVLGFPSDSENCLYFEIQLTFNDQDFTEHYNNIPLKRYARHEVQEKESCLAVFIRPPRPDAYILSISVKHKRNDASEIAENRYEDVCEYGLTAKVSPNACLPPFPHEDSSEYGQTEKAKRFNISAVCRKPTVQAIQGTVELRFASTDSNRSLPRLMGELKSAVLSEEAMKHCIVQRPLSNNTEFVFSLFLPDAGEYTLEVYANDPQRDDNDFFVIWRYLLTSDQTSPVRGLPSMPSNYLGPVPKFAELGLSTVSHSDPFIRADTGELCIRLAYRQKLPLKWSTKLIFATDDSSEDCSNMILQQTKRNQVYFLLRFPRTGFFKLQIYALPANDRSDSLPNVYNYLIEAPAYHWLNGQLMPFPKQFRSWRRDCYLKRPTEGILGLDDNGTLSSKPPRSLPFNVSVPNAISVAVVVGDEWTELDCDGDRWKGEVRMKKHWGTQRKLEVCAKYAASDTEHRALLEYSLAL